MHALLGNPKAVITNVTSIYLVLSLPNLTIKSATASTNINLQTNQLYNFRTNFSSISIIWVCQHTILCLSAYLSVNTILGKLPVGDLGTMDDSTTADCTNLTCTGGE